MLGFLDDRKNEIVKKSPKKYKPQMAYGISVEAPALFQTPYTIVHPETYINPYIPFEQSRQERIPISKTTMIQPLWTKKTNLTTVEEQKILSSTIQDSLNQPTSRYKQSYYEQFSKEKDRFKLRRGQFTDFIERNVKFSSLGPLHGEERTHDRIEKSKKSVVLKHNHSYSTSNASKMISMQKMLKKQTSIQQHSFKHNDSMISDNSKLLTQKTRIRGNREKFHAHFHEVIERRRKAEGVNFRLPKLDVELFLRNKNSKRQKSEGSIEYNDVNEIEKFEQKLQKQIK